MSNALKQWQDQKFGLFIHWGFYSLLGGVWKGRQIPKLGEQIQRHAAIPQDEYAALAADFNPVEFDADAWVDLAKRAGMKYMVITSKHHDGFCMFKSELTDYNMVDATPFGRDVIKELSDACAAGGIQFGVYYSNPDWHYPGAVERETPTAYSVFEEMTPKHADYQVGQLEELLTNYGPMFEIFFDMGTPTLEQSKRFVDTVHRCQPDCLASGRVNNDQGDFLTMPDNHLPDELIDQAWETPGTFYGTWAYKSWIERPEMTGQVRDQIRRLANVIGRGGNFLLNIGPLPDGSLLDYEVEVLERMGEWTERHAEAIYDSEPSPFKKLAWGQCARKPGVLYFHVLEWPEDGELVIPGLMNDVGHATILSAPGADELTVTRRGDDVVIGVPTEAPDDNLTVLRVEIEGEPDIVDPIALPDDDDVIVLDTSVELRHGHYDGMSYRSLYPDVWRGWDFAVETPGRYEATITYRRESDTREYIVTIDDQSTTVDLEGAGDESCELSLGVVNLTPIERATFKLKSGAKREQDEEKRFVPLGIDVEIIVLKPV